MLIYWLTILKYRSILLSTILPNCPEYIYFKLTTPEDVYKNKNYLTQC